MSRFAIFMLLAAVLVVVHAQEENEPLCPVNQFWDRCGNECEPTCSNPTRGQICLGCTHNHGACKCKDGYVRKDGDCVTVDQC